MTSQAVPVQEPLAARHRPDYADAFEVRVAEPDVRSAEQWIRAGLEGAPSMVRATILVAHRVVLGFRLDLRASPDRVLGWRVVTSEPDVIQLEAESRLLRAVLLGRRTPRSTRLTTLLFFRRPVARVIWTVVGPLHRRIAPYLLARAARTQ